MHNRASPLQLEVTWLISARIICPTWHNLYSKAKIFSMSAQPPVLSETLSFSSDGPESFPARFTSQMVTGPFAKLWFLTWNNYPSDWDVLLGLLASLIKWYCQEETSDSGTPHIQGLLEFSKVYGRSELKALFPRIHWEVCRSPAKARRYCLKKRTRTGKQWVFGYRVPRVVRDPLDGFTLHPFQVEIIKLIKSTPDNRKIYWYWSDAGNIGKSSLCKHLVLKYGAIVLGGRVQDALYAVGKLVKADNDPTIVIFDIARNQGSKVEYTSLEKLKDGCFFCSKYESCMVTMNPPHVLVFANQPPVISMMSVDRWVVKCLD